MYATSVVPITASSPATATTPPANEGYQYVETLTIPIYGAPVYSNMNLSAGVPYLLVATGDISQTLNGTHRGDAEYGEYPSGGVTDWWLNNPYAGGGYDYEYGIAIGQSAADLTGFYTKYPYWGPLATDSNHTYEVIYTPASNGELAAKYHDIYYPDNTTGNAGDIALQVAIYRPLPPTPSDLVAKGDTAAHSIDLLWNLQQLSWLSSAYSGSEFQVIERSSNGGTTFSTIATVPASQTTWTDNNVLPNRSYIYRVLSQIGTSQSHPSNLATGALIIDPPQIQPILPQTALRNEPFTLQVEAKDPQLDFGGLTYSLSANSIGLTISGAGLIGGWTPTNQLAGDSYTLTVTVTDSVGVSSSTSFMVTVAPGDSPIQIEPGSIQVHSVGGKQYALSVEAYEPGIDPSDLFYSWSAEWFGNEDAAPPPSSTYSPQGTPEACNTLATIWGAGSYVFTVTVTDSLGNEAQDSVTLTGVISELSSLSVTVPQQSLEVSTGSETLSVQGIDQFGNLIQLGNVVWNVTANGASGSFSNNTALFNAGSTPGVVSVLATASAGGGTESGYATIDVSGLSAPSGLTASNIQPQSFQLNWNPDNASTFASFNVCESLNPNGPFATTLTSLTTNSSPLIPTSPGATYYFEVVAVDSQGIVSPPSGVFTLTAPQENVAVPPVPTNVIARVTAINFAGVTRVALNWTAVMGSILGYDVYRSAVPNFPPSASTLIGSSIDNEYVDNSSLTSGSYYYVVDAVNDLGDSGPSNQASVNLSGPVLPPTAPANVVATAVSGTSVVVTWNDTSYNETEFLIDRSIGSIFGPWTQVGAVPTNVTSFTDTIGSLNTAIFYQVIAVNTAGTATSSRSNGIQGSTPVASGIVLTSASTSIQTGHDDQITATVVDQYGIPLANQPTGFSWSVLAGGAGGTISSSGLYLAPSTLTSVNGVLIDTDTIVATAEGFTGQISLQAVAPQAPVVAITSLVETNGRALLTQDTEIDGIVYDPADGSIAYTLTATPEAGGGPMTIFSGTAAVGTGPNQSGKLGTFTVTSLPDGVYTLTLTATDQFNLTSTANALIQVQSQLKLGNLTLPFTDLTVNVPGSQPVTATRTYDSSTASTDGNLGYGWQLDTTDVLMKTTAVSLPGDGTTPPALRTGDLIYLTLPGVGQQVFEFDPRPSTDLSGKSEGGILVGLIPYDPQFVCVDGSGATLSLIGWDPESHPNNALFSNQINGGWVDDTGLQFNPANSSYHLKYLVKTADGTSYIIDPTQTNGQLISSTNANGNITTYDSSSLIAVQYDVTDGNRIASISDSAGQMVRYAYDSAGDLVGILAADGNSSTYVYNNSLELPYNGTSSTAVSAVITRTSDRTIWNGSAFVSGLGSGSYISLSGVSLANWSASQTQLPPGWYVATAPSGIADGTAVSIAYYVNGTLYWTESRTWTTTCSAHELTSIIDANGVKVLAATYAGAGGQLASLINSNQQAAPVKTGGFDGSSASETVTDAAGNTTVDVYDPQGDVTRKIQVETDASGNLIGYLVTLTNYSYLGQDDTTDPVDTGRSVGNEIINVVSYAPFEVPASEGLFGAESALPTSPIQQETDYITGTATETSAAPGEGQPSEELTYVGTSNTSIDPYIYEVTTFSAYDSLGQPGSVTEQKYNATLTTNGTVQLGSTIGTASTTSSTYDSAGNLITSTDATQQTTGYWYSNDDSLGIPAPMFTGSVPTFPTDGLSANGLLVYTYRIVDGVNLLMSANTYYTATDNHGALEGQLASTTTYNYPSTTATVFTSQTTFYNYDTAGNTVLTTVYKSWSTPSGQTVYGWTVNGTNYDIDGRSVNTWQATYLDGSANSPRMLVVNITSATSASPDSVSVPTTSYTSIINAPIGNSTTYTPDGQTWSMTDEYGGVTTNTYDASGHLIQTQYPDGTETISVYDVLGRVILATDKFIPGQANPILATRTVYNSLGEVVATQQVSGLSITISADPSYPSLSAITAVSGAGLINSNPTDPAEGAWSLSLAGNWAVGAATPAYYSQSQTIYNAQNQVAETDSPTGLRTGTVYYPNGGVEYTGPLNPSASATWYLSADPIGSFLLDPITGRREYTQSISDQVDTLSADSAEPWYGLVYSETIQNDGYSATGQPAVTNTRSFQDSSGRTVFTVYDDGSYTQTLYSVGDIPISGYTENSANPSAAPVLPTIPAGGTETVTIAQRKVGDPAYTTIDVYDATGNLVDVYEPAVADALNSGVMTSPHWHYAYDACGNETSQTDPYGNVTAFTYDANGNKISQTLPDGEKQTWAFDVYGNQILSKVYGATNGTTNTTASQTTYDVYDTSNDGHGGRQLYEYRFAGDVNPTGSTPTGWAEMTSYNYDDTANLTAGYLGLGNIKEVDDYVAANGSSPATSTYTRYTYNPITGNEASITTPEGTVNYRYDPATGELMETWTGTGPAGGSSGGTDILYGYDIQGRLESVSQVQLDGSTAVLSPLPANSQTRYDADGNPVQTYDPTTLYSYDAAGNLIGVSDPNGMTTTYVYDDLNRLTDESVTGTTGAGHPDLFTEHYDLNSDGTRKDAVDTVYVGDTANTIYSKTEDAWTYDADGRLMSDTLTILNDGTGGTSNANGHSAAPYLDAFKYDLANNRAEEDMNGGDGASGGQSIRYSYNHDDQLLTETETTYVSSGATSQVYQTIYTCDFAGNLKTAVRSGNQPSSTTYTYDLRNRMIAAVINNVETDYGYDTNGIRVSEGAPAGTKTYYLNDPNNPTGYTKAIEEKTGTSLTNATTTRSYVIGLRVEAQSDASNGTLYLLTDGHESTRALLNSTGIVIERYSYAAYGVMILGQHINPSTGAVTIITASTAETQWQYGGDGEYDPFSGLTDHDARWTDGFFFTTSDFGNAGMGSLSESTNSTNTSMPTPTL